jgi:cytochrome b561
MRQQYDRIAISLHWTIALLILAAFGLGLTVDDFPKSWDAAVVNAHVLLGLGVLGLSVARLAWRLGHKPPPLLKSGSPLVEALARLAHGLLYLLMLTVPLIGVPTLLYRGRGIDLGLFAIGPVLPRTPTIFHPLTEIHELSAYALLLLAGGHALAALYHHWVLRDRTLARMMPQGAE